MKLDSKVEEALSLFKKTKYFNLVNKIGEVDISGLTKEEIGFNNKYHKGIILILDSAAKSIPIQDSLPIGMLPELHEIEEKTDVPFFYLWEEERDGYTEEVLRKIDEAKYISIF